MINPTTPFPDPEHPSCRAQPGQDATTLLAINVFLLLSIAMAVSIIAYRRRSRKGNIVNPNIRIHNYCQFHAALPPQQLSWSKEQVHRLVGLGVMPTNRSFPPLSIQLVRQQQDPRWNFHEVLFHCGKTLIRGVEIEQRGLKTDRWILFAVGRNGRVSKKLLSPEPYRLLEKFQAHGILFDYAGVGDSPGRINCHQVAKTYRVVLHHLEEHHRAGTIICFSHSMGGGIKAIVTESHEFRPDRTYVFITSRSYTNLNTVIAKTRGVLVARAVGWAGWNISVHTGAARLSALGIHEFILQSTTLSAATLLHSSEQLCPYDDAIPKEATYAHYILEQPLPHKVVIGIPERHSIPMSTETIAFIHQQVSAVII